MPNKHLAAALGALTGLVGLVGMIRLVSGAFSEGMSTFAWVAILLGHAALDCVRRMARQARPSQSRAALWRCCCSILVGCGLCGSPCSAR